MSIDRSGKWSEIVFLQGDEFYDAYDEHGGCERLAEYLSQWDYGDDYDVRDGASWGTHDSVGEYVIGGVAYVLTVNWPFGYAALCRRPIVDTVSSPF